MHSECEKRIKWYLYGPSRFLDLGTASYKWVEKPTLISWGGEYSSAMACAIGMLCYCFHVATLSKTQALQVVVICLWRTKVPPSCSSTSPAHFCPLHRGTTPPPQWQRKWRLPLMHLSRNRLPSQAGMPAHKQHSLAPSKAAHAPASKCQRRHW